MFFQKIISFHQQIPGVLEIHTVIFLKLLLHVLKRQISVTLFILLTNLINNDRIKLLNKSQFNSRIVVVSFHLMIKLHALFFHQLCLYIVICLATVELCVFSA